MADELVSHPIDNPAAKWFRQNLDLLQADLLAVVQRHTPTIGVQATAHGLIELCGSVCRAVVEAEPAGSIDIDEKLLNLRLFVMAAGQEH